MATKEADKGIGTKLRRLFGSLRFWQLTLAAGAAVAAAPASLFVVVAGYLTAVAAVGTADSVAEKIGAAPKK